jgi:hypothetical protein
MSSIRPAAEKRRGDEERQEGGTPFDTDFGIQPATLLIVC